MTAPLHTVYADGTHSRASILTTAIVCRECEFAFAAEPTRDAILAAVRANWACLWLRYPDLGGWACPTHAARWIGGRR